MKTNLSPLIWVISVKTYNHITIPKACLFVDQTMEQIMRWLGVVDVRERERERRERGGGGGGGMEGERRFGLVWFVLFNDTWSQ